MVLPAPPLRPTEPRPPSATALWWARTREAVGSDLAVHGLAYIGVLLFFVGAFGLVVFAFGDVAPTWRPVAELVIALAPFAAAALLLRRGATVVGRALEVAGGLLVPVMLITGFLDDCPFPPDLYGVELAVALTVLTSLVAVAYAAWSWRHPHSALRYLVAPVAWLAVGMATLGLGERDIPDGKAVATPGAAQSAAVLAALVVTVALARLRPTNLLSRPTRVAAVPGLVVVAAMSLLSWAAEGWPFGPVLATGALALVALELLADELPPMVVGLVEPLWWFLVWAALVMGAADLPPDVPDRLARRARRASASSASSSWPAAARAPHPRAPAARPRAGHRPARDDDRRTVGRRGLRGRERVGRRPPDGALRRAGCRPHPRPGHRRPARPGPRLAGRGDERPGGPPDGQPGRAPHHRAGALGRPGAHARTTATGRPGGPPPAPPC